MPGARWERIVEEWERGELPHPPPPPSGPGPPRGGPLDLEAFRRRRLALGALLAAVLMVLTVVASSGGETPSPGAAGAPGPGVAPTDELTLAWVGDTTPGSAHGLPARAGRELFEATRRELRAADLTLANLEGTLGTGGASKCGLSFSPTCFAFQAPPSHARAFRWAGVDVVNLANNHFDDFGPVGRAETEAALASAGLVSTGTPGRVAVVRRRGLRIAVVGFAAYRWAADLRDVAGARALVRRAARRADLVVVTMHAGAEGTAALHVPVGAEYGYGEDRGDTRAFARAVVDAGADLVLGSGPHVVRGLEVRRGRLIAYSVGNFGGAGNFSTAGVLGVAGLLRVRLGRDGRLRGGRWHALRFAGRGHAEPDPAGTSTMLARRLSEEDFGSGEVVGPGGRLRPPPSGSR